MRPPLSPSAHGILEYASAPVWAIAAATLALPVAAKVLAWILAAGVLAAATLTDYPLGLLRVVPLRVHAWVDRCATPLVIAAPWLAGFQGSSAARTLFVLMGSLGLIVTVLTNFNAQGGTRGLLDLEKRRRWT